MFLKMFIKDLIIFLFAFAIVITVAKTCIDKNDLWAKIALVVELAIIIIFVMYAIIY